MKRIKWVVFFMILMLLMTFALISTTAASSVNPEKGPPNLDRIIFVHYPKGMDPGKPSGTPGKGPQEDAFIYSGYHWADTTIPVNYYINPSGSSVIGGSPAQAINSGFQVWEDEPGSYIDFNYAGEIASNSFSDTADGKNIVGWADISGTYKNAIAVTQFWYNPITKELAEVDITLNNNSFFSWWLNSSGENWNAGDSAAYDVDVQNIVAHEVGHWLVLSDLYADNNHR